MLAILIVLAGICMVAYPTVSNWWNQMHQSRAVMSYAAAVSDMDRARYAKLLKAARSYNKRLAQMGAVAQLTTAQESEYDSLLNIEGSGIMGRIRIPKIDVDLPIYHGTDSEVLSTSIGHLAGTSLPVGGKSSHCVLSGHRGLPSARLFSDLDRLKEGDTFTMTVLDKTLTYEVDQIRIVDPTDLSELQIVTGKDYCTLVTCTPYGINTDRLLVRGHRVPNANGNARLIAEALQIRPAYIALFVIVVTLVALAIWAAASGAARHSIPADIEGNYLATRGLERPKRRRLLWRGGEPPATTGRRRRK